MFRSSWRQVWSTQVEGTASPSHSCTVVLTEIAAALESQLEIVSDFPEESIRFPSDGRWSYPLPPSPSPSSPSSPSLFSLFLWDEGCSGIEEIQPSWVRGRSASSDVGMSSGFVKVKQLGATRLALSVALACPSHHLAHSCQGAMYHQPLDLAEVVANLAAVLDAHNHRRKSSEWICVGQQRKRSATGFSTTADQAGGGSHHLAATPRCTHHGYPGVITAAHVTREEMAALPGASGSMDRHAEEYPLLHCGHLRSLHWVRVMVRGDFE